MSIRKPKIDAPTPLEQLKQIKSYLFQLVDELENELANPSGGGSSVDNSKIVLEVQNALQISRQAKKIAENIDLSKYFLKGEGAPNTETVASFEGVLYLDTTNGATYQCTAIDSTIPSYTWVKMIRETDYAYGYANAGANFKAGIVRPVAYSHGGIGIRVGGVNGGEIIIIRALKKTIDDRIPEEYLDGGTTGGNYCRPIVPANLDYAVKKALTDCKLTPDTGDFWTEEDKAKARELLGVGSGTALYRHLASDGMGTSYSFLSFDSTPFLSVNSFSALFLDTFGSFSHIYQYFDSYCRVLSCRFANNEITLYYCDKNGNLTNVTLNTNMFTYEVREEK